MSSKAPAVTLSDTEWKAKLTDQQFRILRKKDTEHPGTGEYNKHYESGTYTCAGCGQELYESVIARRSLHGILSVFSSTSKFNSGCGWPAFSTSLGTSVRRDIDEDGHREEILCANCDGHLGSCSSMNTDVDRAFVLL